MNKKRTSNVETMEKLTLEINKWNVYLAKVPFLEIKETKIRPVVIVAIRGIAAFVLPLTTNLKNKTDIDIIVNFNNTKGLIKVDSMQRIYIKDIIKPWYSIHTDKRIRVDANLRKRIVTNLHLLFHE